MDTEQYRLWKHITEDDRTGLTYTKKVKERDKGIGAFLDFDLQKGISVSDSSPASASAAAAHTPSTAPTAETSEMLRGLPFGVKDNIAVESFPLSCASKSLDGFTSPYTATAVERLLEAGAVPVGKTNLDEFGMGSSTENSSVKKTVNPWDARLTPGGSSGGSAAAVAAGMVPFALGSDTGGSVRQPASFCGIYGLKPTYGSVSRYGLVSYASSLEGIGVLSSDLDLTEETFFRMRGIDEFDQTSINAEKEEPRSAKPDSTSAPNTIGVLEEIEGLSPEIEEGYRETIESLKELGFDVKTVSLPSLEYVVPAYYTIASAEASANLARYTGIRYGYRNEWAEEPQEMVETSRDESLGEEVKLRILLGTYVLRSGFQDKYYIKAQKIRTALRHDFDSLFEKVDLLMMPVFPSQAFPYGEEGLDPFRQKLADKFTATANLAGIPALSFPVGLKSGLPVGMQFLSAMFSEELLFSAARRYTEAFSPKTPADFLDWRTIL